MIKAAGRSLSFSSAQTLVAIKGTNRERKDILTFSYCQPQWEEAVHGRVENIELPFSGHKFISTGQHKLCVYTYSVCELTGEGGSRDRMEA